MFKRVILALIHLTNYNITNSKNSLLTHIAQLSIPTAEASQILKLLASLHRERLRTPSKCCAFARLEATQSQHLQWQKLHCSVTCRSGTSGMLER